MEVSATPVPRNAALLRHCTHCGTGKALEEFRRDRSKRDGLRTRCRTCETHVQQVWYRVHSEKAKARVKDWRKANPERCRAYSRKWSGANRAKARASTREWHAANRDRVNARRRALYATNPDKARASELRRRYGITLEDYNARFKRQDGRCRNPGCRMPETVIDKRTGRPIWLAVDHDHGCCVGEGSCGKCIRGLLCSRCNTMLGWAGDDAAVLEGGAAYLRAAFQ